jgi:hypothetical protein
MGRQRLIEMDGFGQKWSENDGKSAMKPRKKCGDDLPTFTKVLTIYFFPSYCALIIRSKKNNGKP